VTFNYASLLDLLATSFSHWTHKLCQLVNKADCLRERNIYLEELYYTAFIDAALEVRKVRGKRIRHFTNL